MSIIIQSHNYTINLDNVNYFRQGNALEHCVSERLWNEQISEEERGTAFQMSNKRIVMITCPYSEVVKQLKSATSRQFQGGSINTFITLEYDYDTVDESSSVEHVWGGHWVDKILAVARN